MQRNQNILVPSGETILCAGDTVIFTDNEDEFYDENKDEEQNTAPEKEGGKGEIKRM